MIDNWFTAFRFSSRPKFSNMRGRENLNWPFFCLRRLTSAQLLKAKNLLSAGKGKNVNIMIISLRGLALAHGQILHSGINCSLLRIPSPPKQNSSSQRRILISIVYSVLLQLRAISFSLWEKGKNYLFIYWMPFCFSFRPKLSFLRGRKKFKMVDFHLPRLASASCKIILLSGKLICILQPLWFLSRPKSFCYAEWENLMLFVRLSD